MMKLYYKTLHYSCSLNIWIELNMFQTLIVLHALFILHAQIVLKINWRKNLFIFCTHTKSQFDFFVFGFMDVFFWIWSTVLREVNEGLWPILRKCFVILLWFLFLYIFLFFLVMLRHWVLVWSQIRWQGRFEQCLR